MRQVKQLGPAILCVLALLAMIGCGKGKIPTGKVYFSEPKDGAQIQGPVKVVMVVEGMQVKPAGEVSEGTGHHHVLINKESIPAGQVIPTDDADRHFGKGQTETTLDLPPGDYTLTLQFADGLHRSYGKDMSQTIKIKVLPK